VVLVSATLLKYMGSGPKWPFAIMSFQEYCADNWWSALLYVQNYVNVTNMVKKKKWKILDSRMFSVCGTNVVPQYRLPTLLDFTSCILRAVEVPKTLSLDSSTLRFGIYRRIVLCSMGV
jgi:hypothetical protein